MRPVAIVGNHRFTLPLAPWDDQSIEIWAFNAHPMNTRDYPRVDVDIQIHTMKVIQARYKHQIEWIKNTRLPVVMREKFAEFPNCIPYPFDDVFKLISSVSHGVYQRKPLHFLTSSVDYALALAILQNRPTIYLYGIELVNEKKYVNYRPGFEFWCGVAGGRGIKLEICCAAEIFGQPLYGEK